MAVEIGHVFGRLTVLNFDGGLPRMAKLAMFSCECGVQKKIRLAHVVKGITVSCGCVKQKFQAPTGSIFGRLTVKNDTVKRETGNRKVLCRCDCGTEKLVGVWELSNGVTKSCGCLVVEQIKTLCLSHGGEGTPIYNVWHSMKSRCQTPSAGAYKRYGARGITVCKEWTDSFVKFRNWAKDAGYGEGLQLDRINNDGNYEPTNCRFVSPIVNANNRGNHVQLTAFGETKTMSDWARDGRCSVAYSTLKQRVSKQKKLSHEEAITKKVYQRDLKRRI
jgi:hypothetical protein